MILLLGSKSDNIRITQLPPFFPGCHQEKRHRHKTTVAPGSGACGRSQGERVDGGVDVTSNLLLNCEQEEGPGAYT